MALLHTAAKPWMDYKHVWQQTNNQATSGTSLENDVDVETQFATKGQIRHGEKKTPATITKEKLYRRIPAALN